MIKLIVDRADNGNKFLCIDCIHGHKRGGTLTDFEMYCASGYFVSDLDTRPAPVPFVVTKCDGYQSRLLSNDGPEYARLKTQALIAVYEFDDPTKPTKGGTWKFLPYGEAKARRLIY